MLKWDANVSDDGLNTDTITNSKVLLSEEPSYNIVIAQVPLEEIKALQNMDIFYNIFSVCLWNLDIDVKQQNEKFKTTVAKVYRSHRKPCEEATRCSDGSL